MASPAGWRLKMATGKPDATSDDVKVAGLWDYSQRAPPLPHNCLVYIVINLHEQRIHISTNTYIS